MPDEPSLDPTPTEQFSVHAPAAAEMLTAELPVVPASRAGAPGGEANLFEDDGDDEWAIRTTQRRLRMRVPTAVLLGLLLAAGAFWGGAVVQRGRGTSTTGVLSALAARFRGAGGATGASGASGLGLGRFGAGVGGTPTVGTLTDVKGSTLYLTNASGNLVKVVLGPSAKITRIASTSASGLTLGDTVIVEGMAAKNGTVTATSVTATAAGASVGGAGAGGFGGGGFGAADSGSGG